MAPYCNLSNACLMVTVAMLADGKREMIEIYYLIQ